MHDTLSVDELTDHDDLLSADSVGMFEHQVGGHHVIVRHPTRPDLIVKTYFPKEIRFYQDAQSNPELLDVISKFYGTMTVAPFGECIVLEDLTFGLEIPCIMDLKIGRRLYDDDAPPDKISRMIKKSALSTSGSVGFRISGMRCVDPEDGRHVVVRMKKDMWGLKKEDLLPTLRQFFAHLSVQHTTTLLENYIQRLRMIKEAVSRSNGRFYSSSILLVFDHNNPLRWDCRMIDFVHSHILSATEAVVDHNYLDGVQSVIKYLSKLHEHLNRPS